MVLSGWHGDSNGGLLSLNCLSSAQATCCFDCGSCDHDCCLFSACSSGCDVLLSTWICQHQTNASANVTFGCFRPTGRFCFLGVVTTVRTGSACQLASWHLPLRCSKQRSVCNKPFIQELVMMSSEKDVCTNHGALAPANEQGFALTTIKTGDTAELPSSTNC
jgi:hypothetical protein